VAATGPAAEVVTHSTSSISHAHLHAIGAYLKDRYAPDEKPPQPATTSDPGDEDQRGELCR